MLIASALFSATILLAQSAGDNAAAAGIAGLGFVFLLIFGAIGLGVYFVPTIIAFVRNKTNKIAILALNFFLGWSLIGWVVSLVWALSTDNAGQQVVVQNYNSPGHGANLPYGSPQPYAQPQAYQPTQQPYQSPQPYSPGSTLASEGETPTA